MVKPDSCPFCAIISGTDAAARILYRNDQITAFFPLDPATKGHTVVVPNRHVTNLIDLTAPEIREVGEGVQRTARAIRDALRPEGMNVVQSTGRVATQTIPHVHFHVVPRWSHDRMILEWPDDAVEDEIAQDQTLASLQVSLPDDDTSTISPEDRRQHLSFIQAVITRMSQASSSSKSWLLPIITLTYGYAVTQKSIPVAVLGCLAVVVFGLLDANYLKQERAFRNLYDQVSGGGRIPAFAMNPAFASPEGRAVNYWPDAQDWKSWAIAPVHGPLLIAGIGITFWLHCL